MSTPSADFARSFVAALAGMGVRDFVLSPGSRSGPLAHALGEAASTSRPTGAPEIELHVRIDERSAAFVALGIAKAREAAGDARPVAVITTSGTAVGNLLPAVMEAHHSGVPLLLLTADRPGELRGVGANQATDQEGIFGGFVRWATTSVAPDAKEKGSRAAQLAARAVHWATGDPDREQSATAPGPVHINLEFRDPLGADGGEWPQVHPERPTVTDRARSRLQALTLASRKLPDVERGVVIAGADAGPIAAQVAQAHGWPLLAEPTSGARTGPNVVGRYVALLSSDAGAALAASVEQVVVIGRPTLSRPVQRLIAGGKALYVAGHGARWREAPKHAQSVLPSVPEEWLEVDSSTRSSEWLTSWVDAGAKVDAAIAAARGARNSAKATAAQLDGEAIAEAFLGSLAPGALAFVGSSGPIRAVDAVAPAWGHDLGPLLIANRGLAGIDGSISTAMGMALAGHGPVAALMGDVTFLHDAGALLVGSMERRPDLRIVVVNDGGGTIFSGLEHAAGEPTVVARTFTTPHQVDLAGLALAYGAAHSRVTSRAALAKALKSPISGVQIVEAVVSQAVTSQAVASQAVVS